MDENLQNQNTDSISPDVPAQEPSRNNSKYIKIFTVLLVIGLIGAGIYFALKVFAFQADPTPGDNLVYNPWFHAPNDVNTPSLDGWTETESGYLYWSTSKKDSNPSPYEESTCFSRNGDGTYCGTSARLANGSGQGGGGSGQGGVDAYLYQIVEAEPYKTQLQFQTHWVTGWIDEAEVKIYGSQTNDPNGTWDLVWTPLYVTQETGSFHAWTQTDLLETEIASGYPYYKIEIHGRYPANRSQGYKITGLFFSVVGPDNATPDAVLSADPITGNIPLTVNFDASESTDSDGEIASYFWDFGDDTTSEEATVSHEYPEAGEYLVNLTVTDDLGGYETESVTISVIDPDANQLPQAAMSATPESGVVPFQVVFDGGLSTDPDGSIVSWDWDFGDGNIGTGLTVPHTYTAAGDYTATLTVTDDDGDIDTTNTLITASNPAPEVGDPISFWKFSEGDGTTTSDDVNGDLIGNLVGTTWTEDGFDGNALEFTTGADYVQVDDFDLSSNALTVSLWVNHNSLSNGMEMYAFLPGRYTSVRKSGVSDVQAEMKINGSYYRVTAQDVLSEGEWTHVGVTWDGDAIKLYVNGEDSGTYNVTGTLSTQSGTMYIGHPQRSVASGILDEVSVYDVALSASEIAELANN